MEQIVRVFSSIEEADQADAREDARLSPLERLQIVDELRERTHPNASKQEMARVFRVVELESS